MTPTEYTLANPEHCVTICMNVQHSETDKRFRITFDRRRGPYRPVTLGVYVVESWEEALSKHLFAEGEKAKAEAALEAKRQAEKA